MPNLILTFLLSIVLRTCCILSLMLYLIEKCKGIVICFVEQTALMQACQYGHWEVVMTLVLFKANV